MTTFKQSNLHFGYCENCGWPEILHTDTDQSCSSAIRTEKSLRIGRSRQQVEVSDGSTASYYELPEGATELQHLISYRNMNAQIGEIFRACYRMGLVSHSPNIRDVKKIIFYAQAELERLEKYPTTP